MPVLLTFVKPYLDITPQDGVVTKFNKKKFRLAKNKQLGGPERCDIF